MPSACFNPRAREGATIGFSRLKRPIKRFNPRAREGATPKAQLTNSHQVVSIHAPVRARPDRIFPEHVEDFGFNPRAREGATRNLSFGNATLIQFQSTRP